MTTTAANTRVQRLNCGYQPYAWGKTGKHSIIAQMLRENEAKDADEKRYAELWIGTHPSLPARISPATDDGNKNDQQTLREVFETQGPYMLGDDHVRRWGSDVPFLLKVLSIDKALSIQSHPAKDHAARLHQSDAKNYPDANHKPELVVALTPFQALCCFRPVKEVQFFVRNSKALANVLGDAACQQLLLLQETDTNPKAAYQAALARLYGSPVDVVSSSIHDRKVEIKEHAHANHDYDHSKIPLHDDVFLRVEKQFPNDVGCWMVYFLNIVCMNPGDGLFMAPNEPHSYLAGDCVEIMAASDNVVRAGLTPKFKDVQVLLEMLTYRTDSLEGVSYRHDAKLSVQSYHPPTWCEEFSLHAVHLNNPVGGAGVVRSAIVPPLPSGALGVVIRGPAIVNGVKFEAGNTFVVPAADASATGVTVESPDGASEQEVLVFLGCTRSP